MNAAVPALSSSKACRKLIPSNFPTNWIAFPAAPHPMQWYSPFSGLTMNDASPSAWNGHFPTRSLLPCFRNSIPLALTSAARSAVFLIRSISSSGMRGMGGPF